MSNQISLQANKLWQLISAPTTAAIYKQALSVTWTILQETGKLAWLVFCLVLVTLDWFWNNSIRLGRQTRAWFDRFDRTNDVVATEMGQEIMSSLKSNFNSLVTTARNQLGVSSQLSSDTGSDAGSAIVPAASAEIAPISTVSPMKRYEAASEDEPVVLSSGFMADTQGSAAENPSNSNEANSSETIETNAEPETVAVRAVSPKQKERVGEDEEVEQSALKEPNPSVNS